MEFVKVYLEAIVVNLKNRRSAAGAVERSGGGGELREVFACSVTTKLELFPASPHNCSATRELGRHTVT